MTLNMFKMILYQLKMCLHDLKCKSAQINLSKPKRAQILITFLSVMHISISKNVRELSILSNILDVRHVTIFKAA